MHSSFVWSSRRVVASFLCLVALFASSGGAGSVPVEISAGVTGIWQTPDTGWSGRAVLILHGLADNCDGANDLHKRTAQALAENGIASLRINFRGEGDRARTKIESTFATRIEDALAAREFLARTEGVDKARVGLHGWSLGAATALEIAPREPQIFRSLVVWTAPSGSLYECITRTDGPLAVGVEPARRDGWAKVDMGWRVLEFSHAFFESFRGYDTDTQLLAYRGAFLALRGTGDFLPVGEPGFMKAAAGRPAEAVILGDADHTFNTFDPASSHDERAIELTVAWFVRTL